MHDFKTITMNDTAEMNDNASLKLTTDPSRNNMKDATGIYVRAQSDGRWKSVDIAELDTASLKLWLTSRGGSNPWAESVVLLLLGHKP